MERVVKQQQPSIVRNSTLSPARPTVVGPPRRASLSPACQRLVEVLQAVNYGRIEDLRAADGEPLFDPPPRVVRDVLLDRDDAPRPEAGRGDFTLRREVAALLRHVAAAAPGSTMTITVQAGLPVRLQIAGPLEV
jgi:hypothetical protein